jgi:hypothetical protein
VSSTSKSFKSAEIVSPLPFSFLLIDTFSPASTLIQLSPGLTSLILFPSEYKAQPASTLSAVAFIALSKVLAAVVKLSSLWIVICISYSIAYCF